MPRSQRKIPTQPKPRSAPRNRKLASLIERWFVAAARDLPWRKETTSHKGWRRDPYRSLVSEAMLQQTQVSRVIDYYGRFIARFPDVRSLAAAPEQDVLALWSGLGYYRRAKNLHAAARMIVDEFGGDIPRDTAPLRQLPGVGAYTAGAVASMAGGLRVPLVDGNVVRVLLRIEGREGSASDRATLDWVWKRAGELVESSGDAGVLNEGLMELGALVCTPDAPSCSECPVRRLCNAARTGRQREIPAPKKPAKRRSLFCSGVVVARADAHILMERRADTRMWAGMWQVITFERDDRPFTQAEVAAQIATRVHASAAVKRKWGGEGMRPSGSFVHQTTHREIFFDIWMCRLPGNFVPPSDDTAWKSVDEARELPLSNAQRRILASLDRVSAAI